MSSLGGRLTAWWLRAEPHVMGRAATAVVVICLQPAALAQLFTPLTASGVVESTTGGDTLAQVWAVAIVLAGVLMGASYAVREAESWRVLEIGALTLVAVVSAVYVTALLETVGVVGALYLLGTLLALAVNSVGRAVLLGRQIAAAHRLAREYRHHGDDPDDGPADDRGEQQGEPR